MSNIAEDNLRAKLKKIHTMFKERKKAARLQPFRDDLDENKPDEQPVAQTAPIEEPKPTEPLEISQEEKPKGSYLYQKLFWWWK